MSKAARGMYGKRRVANYIKSLVIIIARECSQGPSLLGFNIAADYLATVGLYVFALVSLGRNFYYFLFFFFSSLIFYLNNDTETLRNNLNKER